MLLIASFSPLPAQAKAPNEGQVYYYKQTGVVRNNNKTTGDNTGQFISFTHADCYDSNNQRHDVGNGFLAYKGLNADKTIHTYYGKSYWGENSSYFFSANFAKLNIQTAEGVIYVYEKTAAPTGVTTCAKIYVKPEQPKQSSAVVDTYPVNPGVIYPPGNTSPPVNNFDKQQPVQKILCGSCNGTGNCKSCGGSGNCKKCTGGKVLTDSYYTGGGKILSDCGVCYGTGNCRTCYGNGKCVGCGGRKYL
jgi:hypothetical protein